MAPYTTPPRFLSLEFHTGFFPQVLKNCIHRTKGENQKTGFTSSMEMMIGLAGCVVLVIIGIPSALTHGSIIGWILSIAGAGGVVCLVIISVGSQWRDRPTYDDFLIGIFLLCICMGLFIGIPVGMNHHSFWLGLSSSLAGLAGGYVLGIFAGLQAQRLGWLAVLLHMLATFAAIVLCLAALVLLAVVVFQ